MRPTATTTVALLLLFLHAVHSVSAASVTYEDQALSSITITDPVDNDVIIVRRCTFTGLLRIQGTAGTFATFPAINLKILVEDSNIATTINIRYLHLGPGSNITISNSQTGTGLDIFDMVIRDVPILVKNTWHAYLFYREMIMKSGSTFEMIGSTFPIKSTDNTGYLGELRFSKVDASEDSTLLLDRIVAGYFETATNVFQSANWTISNSLFIADDQCHKANCDLNLTIAANNAHVLLQNCSFQNNSVRLVTSGYTNRSTFTLDQVTIVHAETSPLRNGYAFYTSSTAVFEGQSKLSFVDCDIQLLNAVEGGAPLNAPRAIYLVGTIRNSTLSFLRTKIRGEHHGSTIGDAIYGTAMTSLTNFEIDLWSLDAMYGDIIYLNMESLVNELRFDNIRNSALRFYLRGTIGQSIYVTNSTFNRMDIQSTVFDGASSGLFVADSTLLAIDLDIGTTFRNGAKFTMQNSAVTSILDFANVDVTDGTVSIQDSTYNKWEWTSGTMRRSTALVSRCTNCGTTWILHNVREQSRFWIEQSTFDANILANGMKMSGGSLLMVQSSTIDVQSIGVTAATVTAVHVRSATVEDSTVIIVGNQLRTLRKNSVLPTPLDLSITVYMEGSVTISGDSAIRYFGNNISSSQNDAPGTSLRHDAVTKSGLPLIYTPGEGSGGAAGDVVSIMLYEEATIDLDWCDMWEVSVLNLVFVDPVRPMVLDGVDARKVNSLALRCSGGGSIMPMYITNSRFASLTIAHCNVNFTAPFILEDSLVEGTFTWGQFAVSEPAAAVMFNATVVGGVTNTNPGMLDPSSVRRPPVVQKALLESGLVNASRWNAVQCFPDAPPFSWTPSVSVSLSESGTPTLPLTPSETKSVTNSKTGSTSPTGTESKSLGATASPESTTTRSLSPSESKSSVMTNSITRSRSVTPTKVPEPTATPPPTLTPPIRGLTPSESATIVPPPTPTISLTPCPAVPQFVATNGATKQDILEGGPFAFALRPGRAFIEEATALTNAPVDATAIAIPSSTYHVKWWRNKEKLAIGLAPEGLLSERGVTATITNTSSEAMILFMIEIGDSADEFEFADGYPIGVQVNLEPSFFRKPLCDRTPTIAGTLNIEPTPDPFVEATNDLIQAAGDTNAIVSVIGGAGGMDAVSLAVMSEMGCARPVLKEGGKNQMLLSPAALDNSLSGMLYGSILLVFVIPIVHAGCTAAYGYYVGALQHAPLLAMAFTRFPSWTFGSLGMLHQGLTYVSLRLLITNGVGDDGSESDSSASVAVGGFGFFLVLILPPAFVFIAARFIDATYVEYDYDATPNPPAKMWRKILPRGRWETGETRTAYGILLAPFQKQHPLWAAFQFASPSLVSIVAAARPDSSEGCSYQYGWLAALVALYAFALFKARPYRAWVLNFLAGLSTFSLFGIASISLIQVATGGSTPGSIVLLLLFIYTQMFCNFARIGYIVFNMIFEVSRTEGVVLVPKFRRIPPPNWCSCDYTDNGKELPPVLVPEGRLQPDGTRKSKKKPKEEMEIPLLAVPTKQNKSKDGGPTENHYDPAIHAGGRLLDLADLEDLEALLEEKALPDHLLNEALRRQSVGLGSGQNTLTRLGDGHRKSNVFQDFDDIANVAPPGNQSTESLLDPLAVSSDDGPAAGDGVPAGSTSRGSIFAVPPFDPTEPQGGGGLLQLPIFGRRKSSAGELLGSNAPPGAGATFGGPVVISAPVGPHNPLLDSAMPATQSPRHSLVPGMSPRHSLAAGGFSFDKSQKMRSASLSI